MPAADFFTLPTANPLHENVLNDGRGAGGDRRSRRIGVDAQHVSQGHGPRSVDARRGQRGDCARHERRRVPRARIVLGGVAPIPWRLPEVERMLAGQRITPELAAKAGEAAVARCAAACQKRRKVPLTKAVVKRTLESLGEVRLKADSRMRRS